MTMLAILIISHITILITVLNITKLLFLYSAKRSSKLRSIYLDRKQQYINTNVKN